MSLSFQSYCGSPACSTTHSHPTPPSRRHAIRNPVQYPSSQRYSKRTTPTPPHNFKMDPRFLKQTLQAPVHKLGRPNGSVHPRRSSTRLARQHHKANRRLGIHLRPANLQHRYGAQTRDRKSATPSVPSHHAPARTPQQSQISGPALRRRTAGSKVFLSSTLSVKS